MWLDGKWKPVDFIVTFSSMEHSGLGRYGDPLLPFGDLEVPYTAIALNLSYLHPLLVVSSLLLIESG